MAAQDRARESLAERIAEVLHGPVSVLGLVFVLVVVGQSLAPAGSDAERLFTIASWGIWSLFAAEFVVRLLIAPSVRGFLRRNWWQALFLLVPFLRFLALFRAARASRALTSAVRAGRSAGSRLSRRIGLLVGLTLSVVLGSAELLFATGVFDAMADSLHAAALATITGEPLRSEAGVAQALDVVLGVYSVVFFATLAGALGAFFLERGARNPTSAATSGR